MLTFALSVAMRRYALGTRGGRTAVILLENETATRTNLIIYARGVLFLLGHRFLRDARLGGNARGAVGADRDNPSIHPSIHASTSIEVDWVTTPRSIKVDWVIFQVD